MNDLLLEVEEKDALLCDIKRQQFQAQAQDKVYLIFIALYF